MRARLAVRRLAAFDLVRRRPVALPERQVARVARGRDAGDRAQLGERTRIERGLLLQLGVLALGQVEAHGHAAVAREAGVLVQDLLEALDQQARAHQQRDRERHLHHDERAARRLRALAHGVAAPAFLQHLIGLSAELRECRHEAEQQARDRGDREREREHERVDAHLPAQLALVQAQRAEQAEREVRDQDARDAAHERQRHRLDDELARDAEPARAERSAHAQLLLARADAREHQVRDVRARDQQHERDHRLQQPERGTEIPDPLVAQRLGAPEEVAGLEPLRKAARTLVAQATEALGVVLHDAVHLRVELFDRRAGREAADGFGKLVAALVVRELLVGERERHPELRARVREHEAFGHHAEHAVVLAVQAHVRADDSRVARELALPRAVRDHGHLVAARLRLFIRERAAERGLRAQRAPQRRRRLQADEALRRARRGEVEALARVHREVLERRRLRLAVEVVRDRRARVVEAHLRVVVVHLHEPLAVVVRQRLEQQPVDDREDRRVRADAERERRDGGDEEPRLREQAAQAVADVLDERVEHGDPSLTGRSGTSAPSSSRRTPGSSAFPVAPSRWIPAFAGMTTTKRVDQADVGAACPGRFIRRASSSLRRRCIVSSSTTRPSNMKILRCANSA